jgi:hypothetical protein
LLGEGVVLAVGFGLLLHQALRDREAEAENTETIEKNEARIGELEVQIAALRERMAACEAADGSTRVAGTPTCAPKSVATQTGRTASRWWWG